MRRFYFPFPCKQDNCSASNCSSYTRELLVALTTLALLAILSAVVSYVIAYRRASGDVGAAYAATVAAHGGDVVDTHNRTVHVRDDSDASLNAREDSVADLAAAAAAMAAAAVNSTTTSSDSDADASLSTAVAGSSSMAKVSASLAPALSSPASTSASSSEALTPAKGAHLTDPIILRAMASLAQMTKKKWYSFADEAAHFDGVGGGGSGRDHANVYLPSSLSSPSFAELGRVPFSGTASGSSGDTNNSDDDDDAFLDEFYTWINGLDSGDGGSDGSSRDDAMESNSGSGSFDWLSEFDAVFDSTSSSVSSDVSLGSLEPEGSSNDADDVVCEDIEAMIAFFGLNDDDVIAGHTETTTPPMSNMVMSPELLRMQSNGRRKS
jgi:hypothetical protein